MLPRATTDCDKHLISERMMRDKIAQGVQKGGGGLGPPRGPPPQLLRGMAAKNLPDNTSKKKKKKRRERMGKNHKEGTQGERREV